MLSRSERVNRSIVAVNYEQEYTTVCSISLDYCIFKIFEKIQNCGQSHQRKVLAHP